jgi:hypothetical protein
MSSTSSSTRPPASAGDRSSTESGKSAASAGDRSTTDSAEPKVAIGELVVRTQTVYDPNGTEHVRYALQLPDPPDPENPDVIGVLWLGEAGQVADSDFDPLDPASSS